MFSTCVSDPELQFLSTVVVPGFPDIEDLRSFLAEPRWGGIGPGVVFWDDPVSLVDEGLRDAGDAAQGQRQVAVCALTRDDRVDASRNVPASLQVESVPDDMLDAFAVALLAAYEAKDTVARFIEPEHRDPHVHRLRGVERGPDGGGGGMTVHGAVIVLGGAATLPAARGRGAQALLLRHRLRIARQAGCTHAVATAAQGLASARNLVRAGFEVRERPAYRLPQPT